MFGYQNNDEQKDDNHASEQPEGGVVVPEHHPSVTPPASDFNPALPNPDYNDSKSPSSSSTAPVVTPHPLTTPPHDDGAKPVSDTVATTAPVKTTDGSDNTDELLDIKLQALSQLSPLIGHLDQSPEEKFRTTMMMIQASDNQSLVKDAYAAAKAITDEKAKAQALLDIVNEINYFTQHHDS